MSKTALITGTSGGIGQALAEVFSGAGYHVIGIDRTRGLDDLGHVDYFIEADLGRIAGDEDYAKGVIDECKSQMVSHRLDVLINNAAVQILGETDELTRADWEGSWNVNLLAPFLLTQAFVGALEAASGSVVNISSIHARLTKKGFVAYSTTKAALSGMTRALAVDLGSRVRINAIEPAAIATPMLKEGFEGKPSLYGQLEACHPQTRIGSPSEVAHIALYLASSESRFLHGACISLDGGISSRLFDPG